MKERDATYLLNRFPRLFSSFLKRGEHAHHQFAIGDGWCGILFGICSQIFHLQRRTEKKYAFINIDCLQIKEKFGGLRFYYSIDIECESKSHKLFGNMDHWIRMQLCKWGFAKLYWVSNRFRRNYMYESLFEKVESIIRRGESMSYKTCEVCGVEGKRCQPNGHWIATLCEKHEEETKKEKGEC